MGSTTKKFLNIFNKNFSISINGISLSNLLFEMLLVVAFKTEVFKVVPIQRDARISNVEWIEMDLVMDYVARHDLALG